MQQFAAKVEFPKKPNEEVIMRSIAQAWMEEGFEKGVQEDIKIGEVKGEAKLVKMMLNNGTDLATICKLTGISIKELEKLISKF